MIEASIQRMAENRRVLNEPGYLLHQRPYLETSLLLDVFSRNYGRTTLIAKGVKRKKSRTWGILVPFQQLIMACCWYLSDASSYASAAVAYPYDCPSLIFSAL